MEMLSQIKKFKRTIDFVMGSQRSSVDEVVGASHLWTQV